MRNLYKKIIVSILIILIGGMIEYINDTMFENGFIIVLLPLVVALLLMIVIGVAWNVEPGEYEPLNDELIVEFMEMEIKDVKNAKTYLQKKYIDKKLTDEEYTSKMARL